MVVRFFLTLAIAALGSCLCVRRKIPAGAYIGAVLCTGGFQLATGLAWFPAWLKTICSILIGSYIGTKIRREDIQFLRRIPIGATVVVLSLILYQILASYIMSVCTRQNPLNIVLGLAPGGASEISMIALDIGADAAVVSTLQIIRLMIVVSFTPLLAKRMILRCSTTPPKHRDPAKTPAHAGQGSQCLALSLVCGSLGGFAGKFSGLPGGTLCGAVLLVAAVNLWRGSLHVPPAMKHGAATCSGILSGIQISLTELSALRSALPVILGIDLGWIAVSLAIGLLLSKRFGFSLETALFSAIPGGMSDMGLAAEELGGNTAAVTSVQLCRMIAVLVTTPWLTRWVSS